MAWTKSLGSATKDRLKVKEEKRKHDSLTQKIVRKFFQKSHFFMPFKICLCSVLGLALGDSGCIKHAAHSVSVSLWKQPLLWPPPCYEGHACASEATGRDVEGQPYFWNHCAAAQMRSAVTLIKSHQLPVLVEKSHLLSLPQTGVELMYLEL